MTSKSSPAASFWCSRCKARHPGECPTSAPPAPRDYGKTDGDVAYLFKGASTVSRPRGLPGAIQELLDEGWQEYDVAAPPDDGCRRTLVDHLGPRCRHVYSWQCPKARSEYLANRRKAKP